MWWKEGAETAKEQDQAKEEPALTKELANGRVATAAIIKTASWYGAVGPVDETRAGNEEGEVREPREPRAKAKAKAAKRRAVKKTANASGYQNGSAVSANTPTGGGGNHATSVVWGRTSWHGPAQEATQKGEARPAKAEPKEVRTGRTAPSSSAAAAAVPSGAQVTLRTSATIWYE